MGEDLRISGHVPKSWLAKRLWASGVYDGELLEHAERWTDLELAWEANDRLELVIPLALLRGASKLACARAAAGWIHGARGALRELGWPPEDRQLTADILAGVVAPDVDVARLDELRGRAHQRAARKGAPGRHRYALLSALAHTASLGVQRVHGGQVAAADGELVAAFVLLALRRQNEAAGEDLFAERVNVDAFVASELDLVHTRDWQVAA